MDCPPSSPPRLLPGFAPNKNAKFQIYQDAAAPALPTPLPTSERDALSSPTSDLVLPPRRVLEALRTIRLTPDIPVLVGRSSRACDFVLQSTNKLVSRVHARICYESATDLVTLECLGWNGLDVIVPGRQGPKEYPVVRNQTIYIEKVKGIEVSIQNVRTFIDIVAGPSETTESETDSEEHGHPPRASERKEVDKTAQHIIADKENVDKSETLATPVASPSFKPTSDTDAGETNFQEGVDQELEQTEDKENTKIAKKVRFETPDEPIRVEKAKMTLAEYIRKRAQSVARDWQSVLQQEDENQNIETPASPAVSQTSPATLEAAFQSKSEVTPPETLPAEVEEKELAPKEPAPSTSTEHTNEQETPEPFATSVPSPPSSPALNDHTPTVAQPVAVASEVEPSEEPTSSNPVLASSPTTASKHDNIALDHITTPLSTGPAPEPQAPTVTATTATEPVEPVISDVQAPTVPTQESSQANETKKKRKSIDANASRPNKKAKADESSIERLAANCIAFSRLNSTRLSQVRASNSALEDADTNLLVGTLEQLPYIGVIHREGKDATGKPLEPEYYYISELDPDRERQQMVMQAKGGKSLRACRRTHKQYFYKRPK